MAYPVVANSDKEDRADLRLDLAEVSEVASEDSNRVKLSQARLHKEANLDKELKDYLDSEVCFFFQIKVTRHPC